MNTFYFTVLTVVIAIYVAKFIDLLVQILIESIQLAYKTYINKQQQNNKNMK